MNQTLIKKFLSLTLCAVMCLGSTTAVKALAYDDTSAPMPQSVTTQRAILTMTETISSEKMGFRLTITYKYNDGQSKIIGITKVVKTSEPTGYKIKDISYSAIDGGESYYFSIIYTDPQGKPHSDGATLWA